MGASVYIDGQLGDRIPEMIDILTLISLKSELSTVSPVTLEVSNSVIG
ncbi:MAG: hypothetical protein HC832_04665 [Leptolyngbyaceae cyanobacterium RM1_405_57]|nr:hypothetical protein [Leptolyngbyaceae cyanobacterium RM1_405_57]